jgi:hypothetical protein
MADKRTACRVVIWLSVGFTMNRYLCIKQKNLSEDRYTKITVQMADKKTACRVVIRFYVGFPINWYLCINKKIYKRIQTPKSQGRWLIRRQIVAW